MSAIAPSNIRLPMEDVFALYELKARYLRFIDTKDWDGLLGLLRPDVVVYRQVERPGPNDIRYREADAYVAYVQGALSGKISVHHGHMPELRRVDDVTASGIWAMSDWVEDCETGQGFHGYGHYHEMYVKDDEGWRIKELRLTRIRLDALVPGKSVHTIRTTE